MIYYDSRMLAKRLSVPLAKWKRWAREFLPADPLGGLQSGVARQFSLKDAFRVYLGGCLVGTLKFTIPETRQILSDLSTWLKDNRYYSLNPKVGLNGSGSQYIYIYSRAQGKFTYAVRSCISSGKKVIQTKSDCCDAPLIPIGSDDPEDKDFLTARVINIGRLYNTYLSKLNGASS